MQILIPVPPSNIETLIITAASLHGFGAPNSNLGAPGNTYVDDSTGSLYWKTLSGWSISSATGSTSLHGYGIPDPSLGALGNTYVDDNSGALYWKTLSGWAPN